MFRNDKIGSEFPEIWLYHDREIDETQWYLTQNDEDAINGVQTNSKPEFEAREGENLEEDKSIDQDSLISSNMETLHFNPDSVQYTRTGRVICAPQRYQFETNLTVITYNSYYQVFADDNQVQEVKFAAVRAAIGDGFNHTSKLFPIKFKK